MIPPRRMYGLIGEISQSNIVHAIRSEVRNRPNARRRLEVGLTGIVFASLVLVGIGFSRRGEGGGNCGFLTARRRGDGAALLEARAFTGDEVRLMDDAWLDSSTCRCLPAFRVAVAIVSSWSLSRSCQSSALLTGDVSPWVILLLPGVASIAEDEAEHQMFSKIVGDWVQ